MLNIALLDDNALFLSSLKTQVENYMASFSVECTVHSFSSLDKFKHSNFTEYDILLLDIALGKGENGVRLAQQINRISAHTKIIYMTAYNDFAEDISDSKYCYYLRKPLKTEKLHRALAKAIGEVLTERSSRVSLIQRGQITTLRCSDILYFESSKHHVIVTLSDGTTEMLRTKLGSLENELEVNRVFLRTHKSFIVNMEHIRTMNAQHIELDNGTVLPVSKKYEHVARTYFSDYLLHQ